MTLSKIPGVLLKDHSFPAQRSRWAPGTVTKREAELVGAEFTKSCPSCGRLITKQASLAELRAALCGPTLSAQGNRVKKMGMGPGT